MNILRRTTLSLAAVALFAVPLGWAQYGDAGSSQNAGEFQSAGDPPNRVARVAVIEGNVSLEPAGVNTFSAAELNYPLTAGDRIYAENDALTELQTSGLAVRLSNGADLTVTSLTDGVAQFGLNQGSIRVRTRDLTSFDGSQGVVEIDTPNGAILVRQPGDIRVDSYPQDDTTVVTASSGLVEITGGGLDRSLGANQSLRLSGNPVYAEPLQLLPADALDRFDSTRERQRDRELAASRPYVDPGMIGVSDLGQYGDWAPSPDYGAVWYPRALPAGWQPYRNGHWAWVPPWGWTWVEAEPWGFAPFHYGRWASFDGRWGWVPGPPPAVFAGGRAPRPVYSPALVAFVGGPGFSISVGFGGASGAGVTAWFPLGPREAYTPWYHASPGYVNRVNVTNLYNRNPVEIHNTYNDRTTNLYRTNITNVTQSTYVNRNTATVAIPQRDFAAGRRVADVQPLRLDPNARRQLDSAPILPHPLVTPALAIAQPRGQPRVVPPNPERPVMENRGQFAGAAPANLHPVHPVAVTGQQVQAPGNGTPARGSFPTLPPTLRQPAPANPAPVTGRPGISVPSQTLNPPMSNPGYSQSRPAQPFDDGRPGMSRPAPDRVPATPAQSPAQNLGQNPSRNPAQNPTQTLAARPLPRPVDQPRVLVNRTPPQPLQPPFAVQQQAIQRHDPGRPLGPRQVDNLRNGRPAGAAQQPEAVPHPAPARAPAAAPPAGRPAPSNPAPANPQTPGRPRPQ